MYYNVMHTTDSQNMILTPLCRPNGTTDMKEELPIDRCVDSHGEGKR